MNTIERIRLSLDDIQTIKIHSDFRVLKLSNQGTTINMWVSVDKSNDEVELDIIIKRTGDKIEKHLGYIDTLFIGSEAYHFFADIKDMLDNYLKEVF